MMSYLSHDGLSAEHARRNADAVCEFIQRYKGEPVETQTIAWYFGWTKDRAYRCLRFLEEFGLIERVETNTTPVVRTQKWRHRTGVMPAS